MGLSSQGLSGADLERDELDGIDWLLEGDEDHIEDELDHAGRVVEVLHPNKIGSRRFLL